LEISTEQEWMEAIILLGWRSHRRRTKKEEEEEEEEEEETVHGMKAYKGGKIYLHSCLNSALGENEW
jgi:hypothetical protein